ncbi:LysR family transcriptional regulator ArgP [Niveibacterium umoris]|uniref:LysR family transcriptional regulator (Chromosome initiation inhibitor) n=1 Tax=Niveibacterium umoris TaxID=1193620 RepID=A0A840BQD4_9RHOO|nr:LysR family transcriptional regulator ArgP [Niveibacterium umoris]MBB4012627.1 LysR family transcriptional regulator (chromosome initiation inhibitor) [Niveibacterium umoris]
MKIDFSLLECLETVVTEGSFEKAARTLSITQSAVSQRIRQFEQQVGAPLLYRTRPVTPTPAAQPLLRFARQTQLLALDVWPELLETVTRGRLRIAVNADSLGSWVLPALAPWAERTAAMLDFVVDDQEHTQQWLRDGDVIGSISSDAAAGRGFSSVPLGSMPYVCVASPAFVARHLPRGLDRMAIRAAPALVFNRRDALLAEHLRRHLRIKEPAFPNHFVPAYEAFLNAALLGYGYGLLPRVQCQQALAAGQLVDLTPQTPMVVPLYWNTWQLDSEIVGSLTAALVAGAAAALDPMPRSPARGRAAPPAGPRST